MRRIGLRRKKRGADPIGNMYGKEVRLRRKEGNLPASQWQPHHVQGRSKLNLLFFVMIPRELHLQIHANPNWARETGWLANVNGSFTVAVPAVERARVRWRELVEGLENTQISAPAAGCGTSLGSQS